MLKKITKPLPKQTPAWTKHKMQDNQRDKFSKNNSSFSEYRNSKNKSLSSEDSEDSEIFKDADEEIAVDAMSGKGDEKNGSQAGAIPKNVSNDSENDSSNPSNETEVKKPDFIYPRLNDLTDKDVVELEKLPQMSTIGSTKITSMRRADLKQEETHKIFRALNGNPPSTGFDVKNFTDLEINNVTLKKAIRVGCLEKTIKEIKENMSKMLTNSQNAIAIAEQSKKLADQALQAVNNDASALKVTQDALLECQGIANTLSDTLTGQIGDLGNRVKTLEEDRDPEAIIQKIVGLDNDSNVISKNIGTALNNNPIIKQIKSNHNNHVKTIAEVKENMKAAVDHRQLERRNAIELRILEFRPDPNIHGFSGEFEDADESIHRQIVIDIIREIYPNCDVDDIVSIKPVKYSADRKDGNDIWRPYRLHVRFDNTSVVDKILHKNLKLKKEGQPDKTKYLIVRPRSPAEQIRERELRLRVLAKNMVVPADGHSWIIARNPDGSRGPVLKLNSEINPWQIFDEKTFTTLQIKKATDMYAAENPPQQEESEESEIIVSGMT